MKITDLDIFKFHHTFCNLENTCVTVALPNPILLSNLWKTSKYKTMMIKTLFTQREY